jgi:acyl carrier protein phosphodiesterase
MSDRLSRNGHLLREGIGEVQQHYETIAQGFDRFFPELVKFTYQRRRQFSVA